MYLLLKNPITAIIGWVRPKGISLDAVIILVRFADWIEFRTYNPEVQVSNPVEALGLVVEWYTRLSQKQVPQGMWVRLPSRLPNVFSFDRDDEG
jgi:hypothetical protein